MKFFVGNLTQLRKYLTMRDRDDLMRERNGLIIERDDLASEQEDLMWQRNDLMRQRDDLMRQRDDLMRQRDDLMRQRDDLLRQNELTEPDSDNSTPAVLFNTLPKSASVYVLETLARTLRKTVIAVSPGYFPQDQIDFRQFHKLCSVRGIAQSHLDASPFNQRYLTRLDKIILQFRDPRQALLSWVHHLRRMRSEDQYELIFSVWPPLPEDYFDFNLSEMIDYQLETYLSQILVWQAEWVAFLDEASDPERFLLVTYESFVADSQRYFASLLEFIGGNDLKGIEVKTITPSVDKNFRKGATDEWRHVFSERQKVYATDAIPPSLKARFGWE